MRMVYTVAAMAFWAVPTLATDWLTLPSTYTHDPVSGQRVAQFAPSAAPSAPIEPTFRSSAYRQARSTLSYGQSADNYHRVETWGDPVRPYGEWRFPYRPYSTPYPNWGPPFGGLNLQYGFGFGGYRPPVPHPGASTQNFDGDSELPTGGTFPDGFQGRRNRRPPIFDGPGNPYPAGGNSPYPVAPYYDGFFPNYRQ